MRLIDADELKKKAIIHFYTTNYFRHIMDMVDEAPTVKAEQTAIEVKQNAFDILDQKLTEEYDKSEGMEKRTLKMVFEFMSEALCEAEHDDSVLGQIKAEIEKNIEESEDDMFNVGMEYALEIIDKYISGKRR